MKETDLPVAPALTGDPMKDSANLGIMWVSKEVFDRTRAGDLLTVANTPWDADSPVLVAEVEAFDPSPAYPGIAIALVLMLAFWMIGRRISKASARRGMVEAARVPGTV